MSIYRDEFFQMIQGISETSTLCHHNTVLFLMLTNVSHNIQSRVVDVQKVIKHIELRRKAAAPIHTHHMETWKRYTWIQDQLSGQRYVMNSVCDLFVEAATEKESDSLLSCAKWGLVVTHV